VKAGPLALATIPTSSAVSLVAGLGCLCALSLFLQPKLRRSTSDPRRFFTKSRLRRYQLNLVLHLFCSSSGCLVAAGFLPLWLENGWIRSDGDQSWLRDCSLGNDIGNSGFNVSGSGSGAVRLASHGVGGSLISKCIQSHRGRNAR
jgi:hypothetical protein